MSQAGVFVGPSGVEYRDRKRHLWIVSLFVPGTVFLGPVMTMATGNAGLLWLPLAFYYLAIPLLDMLIGEDRSNPPEEVVPQLEADPFYRRMTYALVPILWGAYLFGMWFVGSYDLPLHGVIAMVLLTGTICGAAGLNLGHELGHKKTPHRALAGQVGSGSSGLWPLPHRTQQGSPSGCGDPGGPRIIPTGGNPSGNLPCGKFPAP